MTQIASKAGVSRAAVFWHFSDKDTLFRAAAKQFVVPFREGLTRHLRHLEPRKRIIELITYYEQFVEQNRPNIVAFVNWVLESPEQSEPMRDELLGLHEAFREEVETALSEILGNAESASEYADGLISLMDGNLMLGIFGAGDSARARQRSGLRAVAELIAEDQEFRASIPQDERQLVRHEPPIERHKDRTELGNRQKRLDILD